MPHESRSFPCFLSSSIFPLSFLVCVYLNILLFVWVIVLLAISCFDCVIEKSIGLITFAARDALVSYVRALRMSECLLDRLPKFWEGLVVLVLKLPSSGSNLLAGL